MTDYEPTSEEYYIAGICNAIWEELSKAEIFDAINLSKNGSEFDAAIEASIRLNEIIRGK